MMKESWMEVLPPPAPYLASSSWFLSQKRSKIWSQEENKVFEDALARIDGDAPDRWEKVAAMIPGKTVRDVITHYEDLENDVNFIEAGLVPFPQYNSSGFVLDWENGNGFDGFKQSYSVGGKRCGGRASDQERKKGIPWTEEEHKLFLMGLKKYGRGDWRNISRNFVTSRTPTQVASHAQKYFIRLNSGGKDKRRSSIHDITTVNLPDDDRAPSPSQPSTVTSRSGSASSVATSDQFSVIASSKQANGAHSNQFMQTPPGISPYGIGFDTQMQSNYLHSQG
ncbi:transcription factor DIVARICATA-like [Typha latifolia]|uniref:transcription factor DIVARICATA-like n=1 Tax=Typha latifolia TaxID=4733 RepID=UPI003C2AF91E